jgi:integrase
MSRPRGNIKQRSPGSYRLRYEVGRDPATGERVRATTTVQGTRRDAERELTKLLRAVDTNEHVDTSRMTVGEWLDHWLASIRTEISPKTHESYAEIVRCYLKPALGGVRLGKLTPSDIQTASNGWTLRDGRPMSQATRRYIHVILKAALKRAVQQQALARNPAEVFKKFKVERTKKMVTLTVEQSARLLEFLDNSRVYWPVLLALSTGMRRGEILAIRWRDIDLGRGSLRVMQSLEETRMGGVRFKPPKTNRTRVIALPWFAVEELRRLKHLQAEELLRLGVRQTGDTLVCCREDGEPKHPGSLTSEFRSLLDRFGDMPRVRFHDLRHSHATQLLADGVHPKVAQERLGHSTIATTMDLYSHVTDTMQSDAAARLDAAFRPAIKRR